LAKEGDTDSEYKRVKIAVIDTGIAREHRQIQNFVVEDFIECPNRKFRDDLGHDTNSVDLILRVLDTAQIYVARVFQNKEDKEGDEKTPDYMIRVGRPRGAFIFILAWLLTVTAGYRLAISQKVDIISISGGFENRHDELANAVKRASAAKPEILIFAAAANWGNTQSVAYPARLTGQVFASSRRTPR
jgi:hypothetical protein